jgi:hypothetical protein
MATIAKQAQAPDREEERPHRPSKKEQILSLYTAGISDVQDLAVITRSRPSYVATVLQESEHAPAYFDLYTSTSQPMNVYSKFFAEKLGFKDEEAARRSVEWIDHLYWQFALAGDRAGQHHALLMALTMFDRARWIGKAQEADVFRRWLKERLDDADPAGEPRSGAAVRQASASPRKPR